MVTATVGEDTSLPVRGAWIEMSFWMARATIRDAVAPRAGSVD